MENRAAKQALCTAKMFAQKGEKSGKPDVEILRALMKQYEQNENVKKLMDKSDRDIGEQLDFARAMVVTDVSGVMEDEVNIMIAMKPHAERTMRKGVQAILDNLRRTERTRARKLPTVSRSIFEDDEANQMEAEKLVRGKDEAASSSNMHNESREEATGSQPVFHFGIAPLSGARVDPGLSRADSPSPPEEPSWSMIEWHTQGLPGEPDAVDVLSDSSCEL